MGVCNEIWGSFAKYSHGTGRIQTHELETETAEIGIFEMPKICPVSLTSKRADHFYIHFCLLKYNLIGNFIELYSKI